MNITNILTVKNGNDILNTTNYRTPKNSYFGEYTGGTTL